MCSAVLLTGRRQRSSLFLYLAGLFVAYVLHDAIQERCFRTPGFTFGWVMTLFEIGTMAAAAVLLEGGLDPSNAGRRPKQKPQRGAVWKCLACLVLDPISDPMWAAPACIPTPGV